MSLSAAVVLDLGGALSHGAIVAWEMGTPCVVNTKRGTRLLCTGDFVKVDGTGGCVRVLGWAPEPA
jgi:pyruvate,water dikinase